jgi:hypothetical protein
MFDWLTRDRREFTYFLAKATIKKIHINDENKPHEFFDEMQLVKARDRREAFRIFEWFIDQKKNSYSICVVEKYNQFEEALSN